MSKEKFLWKIRVRWLFVFALLSACVDQITFDIPSAQEQIVIEGMISDEPGPYKVIVSKGLDLGADSIVRVPVQKVKITLHDDEGNTEQLMESAPGEYSTGGVIQGQVGHSYYIQLETVDGRLFESEPEIINPVGEIEEIRHVYESRTKKEEFGEIQADVFNIFIDAKASTNTENYLRWRFKGTYKVTTYPSLHQTWIPPYTPYKNPFPCSGYIIGPGAGGGTLIKTGECTCCDCWAAQYETEPQLSDTQLITGGEFKNIKVGEVPVNNATFYEKYMVEVEQMSLTKKSFEFFKLIREQKKGASSIFQPPTSEIKGNIRSVNSNENVIGIFWASAVRKKNIFIYPSELPYKITPIDFITYPCDKTVYPNSSFTKPDLW